MYQRWCEREIDNLLFVEYAKSNPDEDKIRRFIHFGADINAIDNKGETLLINAIGHACDCLDPKYIRLLVDAGVDLSHTYEGMNCIYYALMSGNPVIVSMLLEAGADPNCISEDSPVSLLHWAEAKLMFDEYSHSTCIAQLREVVELLKLHGARSATEMMQEQTLQLIADTSFSA